MLQGVLLNEPVFRKREASGTEDLTPFNLKRDADEVSTAEPGHPPAGK
jgi:hypothetical protein